MLNATTTESQGARLVLDDPLPAGFEIDNPHILGERRRRGARLAGARSPMSRTSSSAPTASSRRGTSAAGGATEFQFAYIVRAVSPGTFLHPAALIEDMYRPERRARTDTGTVEVVGPLK